MKTSALRKFSSFFSAFTTIAFTMSDSYLASHSKAVFEAQDAKMFFVINYLMLRSTRSF